MSTNSKHYSLRLDAESQAIIARGHERRARKGQARLSDSAMIQALLRLGERYQTERAHGRSLEAMLKNAVLEPVADPAPPPPSPAEPRAETPVASRPAAADVLASALAALAPEVTELRRAQRVNIRDAVERLCELAPGLDQAAAWDWLQGSVVPKGPDTAAILQRAATRYAGELRSARDARAEA